MLPRALEILNYVNFWNREIKFFLDGRNELQAEYDVLLGLHETEENLESTVRHMYELFIISMENVRDIFEVQLCQSGELTLPREPERVSTDEEALNASREIRAYWKENMDPAFEDWGLEDVDYCLQLSREQKSHGRFPAGTDPSSLSPQPHEPV